MALKMKLSPYEKYLQILFETHFRINLQKIDEQGGRTGSTSDFELVHDGQRVFVCELKDFENTEPSVENGWNIVHHADGSVESFRKSNAINRISKDIAKAHKQLIKYSEPKILVFLNHTSRLNVGDFDETFRGYIILGEENGVRYTNTAARPASEGKIKELKWEIDLYIWVDAITISATGRNEQFYFRTVTEIGRVMFKRFFRTLTKDSSE